MRLLILFILLILVSCAVPPPPIEKEEKQTNAIEKADEGIKLFENQSTNILIRGRKHTIMFLNIFIDCNTNTTPTKKAHMQIDNEKVLIKPVNPWISKNIVVDVLELDIITNKMFIRFRAY